MKQEHELQLAQMKYQTQLEIERMKAEIAIRLAMMDKLALKNASAETTERAI